MYQIAVSRTHECDDADAARRCIYQPEVAPEIIPEAPTLKHCIDAPTFIIQGDTERNCTHVCPEHVVRIMRLLAWASPLLVYVPEAA